MARSRPSEQQPQQAFLVQHSAAAVARPSVPLATQEAAQVEAAVHQEVLAAMAVALFREVPVGSVVAVGGASARRHLAGGAAAVTASHRKNEQQRAPWILPWSPL